MHALSVTIEAAAAMEKKLAESKLFNDQCHCLDMRKNAPCTFNLEAKIMQAAATAFAATTATTTAAKAH